MSKSLDRELANEKLEEPCGKALSRLRGHWSGLTLFIDDARIPLDNNASERMIRNPAVGRKIYYDSGSEWSGRLAMTWYFEACAAAGGKAAPPTPPHWRMFTSATTQIQPQETVRKRRRCKQRTGQ